MTFLGAVRDYVGDTLSPKLFDIMMEVLSHLLALAINDGFISGFLVGTANNSSLMVSHLFICRWHLNFCDVDLSQIAKLKDIIFLFEFVSGLKINLGKSKSLTVGGSKQNRGFNGSIGK